MTLKAVAKGEKNVAPDRKDKKRWWLVFAATAIGLGLVLGSLGAMGASNLPQWIMVAAWFSGLGLLILILGRLRWVEWVLLLSLAGVVASLPLLLSPKAADTDVEVPIPANRLVGGTEPLSPGQVVELVVRAPDDQGTPTAYTLSDIKVRAFVGEAGEKGTVLIAVPSEGARDLQRALLDDTSRFTYRLLPGTATPTPTPEQSPTPTPTLIPVVFSLEATRISSDLSTLSDTDNRVAVILVVATIDDESKALTHKAHHYDAELIGAYDSSGEPLPVEEQGTPITSPYTTADSLRISLPLSSEGGVKFAGHLADADQVYVIPLPPVTPAPTEGE